MVSGIVAKPTGIKISSLCQPLINKYFFRFRKLVRSNNFDDVRDEWERIQTSYEILSDEKTRKRYDRHEFVADPGAAIRRAAVGAAATGVSSIGKGLFSMGASAFERIAKK